MPDAFLNDWYGWLTNQSGHILLGMVMLFVLGWLLSDNCLGMIMTALTYGAIEIVHYKFLGGLARDSGVDLFFVLIGAIFMFAALSMWKWRKEAMTACIIAASAALSLGVWRRWK